MSISNQRKTWKSQWKDLIKTHNKEKEPSYFVSVGQSWVKESTSKINSVGVSSSSVFPTLAKATLSLLKKANTLERWNTLMLQNGNSSRHQRPSIRVLVVQSDIHKIMVQSYCLITVTSKPTRIAYQWLQTFLNGSRKTGK